MGPSVKVQIGSLFVQLDGRTPRVLVGRDPSCGLMSEDPGVSRRHAEVIFENGQVLVRDLGSSNGTWLDGQEVTGQAVAIRPGQQVFVGTVPLGVEWTGGAAGRTVVGELPPELRARIDAHRAQAAAPAHWAPPPLSQEAVLGVGGAASPSAGGLAYRREGRNENGSLLIALPRDTFSNEGAIEGHLEYRALDDETISSIILELVEHFKGEPKGGHVWDRALIRQGPWRSRKGDVLMMPFTLRVPSGTSISGPNVRWELRGLVDIAWAVDVECDADISMRNIDVERLRDALGALDYRLAEVESTPLGQKFELTMTPPPAQRGDITELELDGEYLGTDLQLRVSVKRRGLLKGERRGEITFALDQLRTAAIGQLGQYLKQQIDGMLA